MATELRRRAIKGALHTCPKRVPACAPGSPAVDANAVALYENWRYADLERR